MMERHILRSALAGAALAALACSAPPPDESMWLNELVESRELKDSFFREAPGGFG
ncbi:MAG: hypothetical protein OXG35_34080 [Acidobacteria bacterium]|nr:hypothetical protein [Acidobacteriota bacterium]